MGMERLYIPLNGSKSNNICLNFYILHLKFNLNDSSSLFISVYCIVYTHRFPFRTFHPQTFYSVLIFNLLIHLRFQFYFHMSLLRIGFPIGIPFCVELLGLKELAVAASKIHWRWKPYQLRNKETTLNPTSTIYIVLV